VSLLRPHDLVKECRHLIKTLVLGLKNIVWGITSTVFNNNAALPLEVTESLIFTSLLKNGLKCFSIYSADPKSDQEEREVCFLCTGIRFSYFFSC